MITQGGRYSTSESGKPEVVVVTGGTAGVGRAVVRAYAQRGARLGILARGEAGLAATVRDVERLGGRALGLQTDVADAGQIEEAAEKIEEAFGPIDVWINNAMTSIFGEFIDVDPDEFRRVTDVTYHGTVFGTMSALRRMVPRDRGTIVFVGSALAYRGIPLQAAYCGAKHAIQGVFDSLRTELIHRGSNVQITMVQLPALNTPQFSWVRSRLPRKAQPVPPIFQPEVAADAIIYAAHSRRREVFVGFPTARAILGNRVMPGAIDRYLAKTGYESQQREESEDPYRPDNLFEPVDGDWGAHGEFDVQAKATSRQLWASKNRGWIGVAGVGLLGLLGTTLLARMGGNGTRG